MKMKACLMAVMLLFVGQAVFSQSLEEAKKDMYYGHNKAALETLEALAASKPSENVYYYLGIAQTKAEQLDKAAQSFNKAKQVARKNEFPLTYVGLGRIDILNKKYEAAKQQFQKAWEESKGREMSVLRGILNATALDPEADQKYALNLLKEFKNDRHNRKYEFTAQDYTAIGNVYVNLSTGGGKAATNYESALRVNPKYAKAAMELGNLWNRARQDSLARLNWNKAVEADPNYAPALYKLFTYYRIRDLEKAKKYLSRYMAKTDDKLNAKINLVDVMYLQKNYQGAIDNAHKLMEKPISEDTRTRLYKLIAVSELKMGDSLAAQKSMDTYFERMPDEEELPFDYKTYADIMDKLGNEQMQLKYLNKYVDADTTTNLNFIRSTANKLRKGESFKAAELWFQKLFEMADSTQLTMGDYYYRALSKYGAALNGIGAYDVAVSSWSKFIDKYPDQPSGYYFKARTLQMKDTALVGLAIDDYKLYISKIDPEKLSEKQNTLKTIYIYIAKCAATQKDYEKAIEYGNKLLNFDPHSSVVANIYGAMALTNLKAKKLDLASTYANKALSIDPKNTVAPQVLSYVKKMREYQKKMEAYKKAKKASQQAQQ